MLSTFEIALIVFSIGTLGWFLPIAVMQLIFNTPYEKPKKRKER